MLLILIPGPDTAVVTKNALLGGHRSGMLAAVGVSLGLTVWTFAAALGIAALLKASAVAFLVLKLAGAAYLVWIGIQMLRARNVLDDLERSRPHGAVKALRQGLLSDLGNPKIAVFFTSFLPQFVHSGGSVFVPLLTLGGIFAVLTLALARGLRAADRARLGAAAPLARPHGARPLHGSRADRVRHPARLRAPLRLKSPGRGR